VVFCRITSLGVRSQ